MLVVAAELLLRRRRRRRMRGRLISWCGSRPPRRPPLLRAVAATPVLLIPDLVCLALTATQTNERLPSSAAAPSPPPARPQTADPAAASTAARSYSIIAPGRTASSSAYPRPATAKERTPPWSRDTQPGDAPRPPLAAAFRPGGKRTQGLGGGGQPQSVRGGGGGGGGGGGATARTSTADGERLAGTSLLSCELDRGSTCVKNSAHGFGPPRGGPLSVL